MKPDDIREMGDQELDDRLGELRAEWRDLRFDETVGKLTNPMRIRQIKRDIARIKTIQTERDIAAQLDAAIRG